MNMMLKAVKQLLYRSLKSNKRVYHINTKKLLPPRTLPATAPVAPATAPVAPAAAPTAAPVTGDAMTEPLPSTKAVYRIPDRDTIVESTKAVCRTMLTDMFLLFVFW